MSILVSSVITMARDWWKESAQGDILSDAKTYTYINSAVLMVRSRRTDATIDDNGNLTEHVAVTGVSDAILLDSKYLPCLANYLCACGFMTNENAENDAARAKRHMDAFREELESV